MPGREDFEPRIDRREADRIECELLSCPLGQVADLSVTGMQVRGAGQATFERGDVLKVSLNGVPYPVAVRAEVVWLQTQVEGGFAAGFRFRGLDDQAIGDLGKLARTEQQIGAVTEEGLVRFPDVQN